MVETTLLDPFKRAVHCSAAGAWFDTAPWLDQPPLFWREALRRLCHAMGTGMVKEKAVLELLTRLRRGARDGWIPLKRDNKSYICGTRVVRPHPPRAQHPLIMSCVSAPSRPSSRRTSSRVTSSCISQPARL
jgi:hypothetical protein